MDFVLLVFVLLLFLLINILWILDGPYIDVRENVYHWIN